MTVTAVQFQTVVDIGAVSDRVLEREHEKPIRAQGSCERRDDALQVAEVHERVGRHDQVEGFAVIAQVLRQLSFHQRVVDVLAPSRAPASLRRDPRRPTGAQKARRSRRKVPFHSPRPARRGMRRLKAGILQHCRDERRRAIRQPLELRFEARRKTVEGCLDKAIRCAFRYISTGAGRQHVPRNRIPRLFFEPFFEDIHRLTDLAQRAVRQRQQLPRFAVLRSERDHFAVTRRGFFSAFQPVEQNAQVGIRVNVFRVQSDGCAIRGFRFDRLSGRPQQHSQIVVGVRVARIDGDRTPVRVDSAHPACRPIGRRCRGCSTSRPDRARARGSAR